MAATIMDDAEDLSRTGRLLLRVGLGLIVYAALEGFVIPLLAAPRIALSVHTLAGFEGVFLLAQGLMWPQLRLSARASAIAFWLSVYATLAILAAYTFAAASGSGLETIHIVGEAPHGLRQGDALQEAIVRILAYSSAPTGLVAYAIMAFGLRGTFPKASTTV